MRRFISLCFGVLLSAACNDAAAPRVPLSVAPASLLLNVGDTARLTTSDARAAITWRSATLAVATVNRDGLVTAVGAGTASVWAIRGGDSASATVRVSSIKCLGAASVSPASATMTVGDTVRAGANVNTSCTAVPGTANWESSDPSVAVVVSRDVDASTAIAVISALRPGQAVITARSAIDPTIGASMAVVVR